MKRIKKKCPICLGKGYVWKEIKYHISQDTKKKVIKLFRQGKSLREIARVVGIKHPQSIKHIITHY